MLLFDLWLEFPSELLSLNRPAKNNLPLSRFAILLCGVVCALGWEDYLCVVGDFFALVGAGGNYFRDGMGPFITTFCLLFCHFVWFRGGDKG